MKKLKVILFVIGLSLMLLPSCSQPNNKQDESRDTKDSLTTPLKEKESPFQKFSKAFPNENTEILQTPNEDISHDSVLNNNELKTFIGTARFKPAFGVKDVPALEDNIESSRYYKMCVFAESDSFKAYIIGKQNQEGKYFYLTTFTNEGKYISGMCLAFTEGSLNDRTERVSAMVDDMTFQIRQYDFNHGKRQNVLSRFYQLTPNGNIKLFRAGYM